MLNKIKKWIYKIKLQRYYKKEKKEDKMLYNRYIRKGGK